MTQRYKANKLPRIARVALVLGILVATIALSTSPATASKAIAEAENGVACTVCHDKPGSKLYTDRGKFYEATGSLEGFDEVILAFRACTTCHVKRPGSDKFTPNGKRFVGLMRDMTDLRDWAMAAHPATEDTEADGGSALSDERSETEVEAGDTEVDETEVDDTWPLPLLRSNRR